MPQDGLQENSSRFYARMKNSSHIFVGKSYLLMYERENTNCIDDKLSLAFDHIPTAAEFCERLAKSHGSFI